MASSIYDWSTDPASNATADENINWSEGMPPSGVNNSARQMMGRVAEYIKDIGGILESSGTANSITLTANSAITTYTNGLRFTFRAGATNNGAATLNVNNLGAKAIRKQVGSEDVPLDGGEIVEGCVYEVIYSSGIDSGSGGWQLINPPSVNHLDIYVPVSAVLPYAGTLAPDGYLFCYGQAVSRTTYADLFAAIGTTYGNGNGSTTFNLPDLRGRVVAGKDNMGGTSANRLTGQSGGVNGDNLGATGGAETHTLTTAQLASHFHGAGTLTAASAGAHTHTVVAFYGEGSGPQIGGGISGGSNSTRTTSSAGAHTHTITGSTANAGSGQAHNNVQPTIILNYIIKY